MLPAQTLLSHARALLRDIGLVVWDFDGVIADTEPVQADAYRTMLETPRRALLDDFFDDQVGRTEPEIWANLLMEYPLDGTLDDLIRRRAQVYLDLAVRSLIPSWFVRPLTNAAAAAGAQNIIVSSGNHATICALLEAWQLDHGVFSRILALGSPESEAMGDKRERVRRVLTECPAPALVVEDNQGYLAHARALGARTIGVRHRYAPLTSADADLLLPITES